MRGGPGAPRRRRPGAEAACLTAGSMPLGSAEDWHRARHHPPRGATAMPSKHLLSGPPKGSSSLGQPAYSAATPPTPAFPRNPSHVGGHARLGRTPNC